MSDSKIAERVAKMPAWLQDWYQQTHRVVFDRMPNTGPDGPTPNELAERIAFDLAVEEYKRRGKSKAAWGEMIAAVLEATDQFEFSVGSEQEFNVSVQPVDAHGILSLTVAPKVD